MTPVRANLLTGVLLAATVGVLIAQGQTALAVFVAVVVWIVLWPLWRLGGRRLEPLVEPVEPAGEDPGAGGAREAAWSNGGQRAPERGPGRHG